MKNLNKIAVVAIHNQIYYSRYYHISIYSRQSNGAWKLSDSYGYRGPGNHLGMSLSEAKEYAKRKNTEYGWNTGKTNIQGLNGETRFVIEA